MEFKEILIAFGAGVGVLILFGALFMGFLWLASPFVIGWIG